ncbi:type IV pilus assembly protein FimV, partial [Ideonella azotifigens]
PAVATATAAAVAATFQPGRTAPFGPLVQAEEAPREVSVEELLDLEQQADFFIALGQEDAAIDLLMSYLRSTGGQSPVPYTKLLEIYRRQGDRSAYERIRARFNRRFNAYAPDWDMGPLYGRVLEDYPYAVQELETAWPSPLDAMAVLEGMLFRKDETQDLFDLPAYKDLLLMYAIARDLLQQGGGKTDEVDLLLPLGDFGGPAGLVGGPAGSSDGDRAEEPDLVLDDAPDSLLTHFEFNPVPPDSEPMSLDGPEAPAAPAPRKPRF